MNLSKLLTSSSDPTALSLTVKGVLVAILPVALVVTGVSESDANALIESIVDIVFYGATLFSLVMTAYGLVRKVIKGRWSAAE